MVMECRCQSMLYRVVYQNSASTNPTGFPRASYTAIKAVNPLPPSLKAATFTLLGSRPWIATATSGFKLAVSE